MWIRVSLKVRIIISHSYLELEQFTFDSPDFEKERNELLEICSNNILSSSNYPSIFYELNRILIESIINNQDTLLCDMPELLLRMQIATEYSLEEMQEMFNETMSSIDKRRGPL